MRVNQEDGAQVTNGAPDLVQAADVVEALVAPLREHRVAREHDAVRAPEVSS